MDMEVKLWKLSDVGKWLEINGFSSHKAVFSNHRIDGVALLLLTEYDLKKDMAIGCVGDVKRICAAISELRLRGVGVNGTRGALSCGCCCCQTRNSNRDYQKCEAKSSLTSRNLSPPKVSNKRNRNYSSDSQVDQYSGVSAGTSSVDGLWYYGFSRANRTTGLATNLKAEYFRTFVSCLYMFLVTWVTAIVMVFVHDRVPDKERHPPLPDIFLDNVPHISWSFQLCEIAILILVITWVTILFFHKHRSILLRRFSALSGSVFLLRCATMFITSLSVPGHHQECAPRVQTDIWTKLHQASIIWTGGGLSIKGVRTCGDYMFSGHTTALTLLNFFITEYTPRKMYFLHIASWVLNTFGIFFILSAHEHYSIDVFIAFYITSRMFLYYHSLANNRALLQRDSFRTKIWFPMFSYFEAHIDGIVPNEYSNPLSSNNISWFITKIAVCSKNFIISLFYTRRPSRIYKKKKSH